MKETQSSQHISPRLQRIAAMAREHPERAFTNLAHHIDVEFLRCAYECTRKDGAVGVDGVTGAAYGEQLEDNLQSLLDRAKSGAYSAPPVRRVLIPKGDGRMRPLGIPTFEDKVLQRAVAMVLEPIYEADFKSGSYGFRPGRSAHQALTTIWETTMSMGGAWIIEADIRDCFGSLDHEWMRKILARRIRDGVLLRLIGKWLNAGHLDQGLLHRTLVGSPQGGVISPLLANIYLHDVLDVWFAEAVQPKLRGRSALVRYADDFVIICEREDDARRIFKHLPGRFLAHGLELHPEKTRLIPFKRPSGPHEPESWDFLGFTHYWAQSRNGYPVVKRKTMRKRLARGLKKVRAECRRRMHEPVREQWRYLCWAIRGHCAYYGITGNSQSVRQFRREVCGIWRKWLRRRSSAAGRKSYPWWDQLAARYPLPPALAVHSSLRPR